MFTLALKLALSHTGHRDVHTSLCGSKAFTPYLYAPLVIINVQGVVI